MLRIAFINCIILFTTISCNTMLSQQNQQEEFEVLEIQEFETFYLMKSRKGLNEAVYYLISLKPKFYSNKNSNYYFNNETALNICDNRKNKFVLQKVKPSVSSMEGLGAYIIIDNDTLWKGNNYKEAPKTYITLNTLGLKINN